MKIGQFIRMRRLAAGHSLRALATLVDVDPAYLSRVERGLVPPSDALIQAVSEVLGLSLEELFLRDGRVPPAWKIAISTSPETATRLLRETVARLSPPPPPADSTTDADFHIRAIETDCFPFEHLSDIAEAESWRKEVNRPIYHLHKWWAQRLGSVFRGILLGCFLGADADLMKSFYRPIRATDQVVFDPFMGSGTTVGEALKVGARAIGRDINPVSGFAVRNALRHHCRRRLSDEFRGVMAKARKQLLSHYHSAGSGTPVAIQYYFWVKHLGCPDCSHRVDLFRTYVFSKHAYPRKNPEAKVVCPQCDQINDRMYDVAETTCDYCGYLFNAKAGPARGPYAHCRHCSYKFRIATQTRALGHPLGQRMFAKIWIDDARRRRYEAIDDADLATFAQAATALSEGEGLWPHVRIQPGHNTNQILANGYTHWHQMFNERQLLVLGTLGRLVMTIEDPGTRDMLLCAFSGLLEFNNMFTSFKGEGSGAVRHLFSHHILKPERLPFETNPLGRSGSGTFQGIFQRRVLKAIDYAREPFELRVASGHRTANTKIGGLSESIGCESASNGHEFANELSRLYLSVGDSAHTDVETETVDVIVTDPPFFDNVNYSELADFFWVWLRHLDPGRLGSKRDSTRSVREVQHQDHREFSRRLTKVWRECHRVLAPDGLLVFTYHHSKAEGWESLLAALLEADFVIVACHPVKAELSVARPKAQARHPIDLDVIVVCRKREATMTITPTDLAHVLAHASSAARHQVVRFNRTGRVLGQGDVRVILTAQILKGLSQGLPLPLAVDWLQKSLPFIRTATGDIVGRQDDWQRDVADPQIKLL